VLLADGAVGSRIVDVLLESDPAALVGLVVTDTSANIADKARRVRQSLPIAPWAGKNDPKLRNWVSDLHPDIILLAWWPHIVGDEILSGPWITLNLHPSLLPFGRGKDPNFWALVDNEPYGVTIHHVRPGVDEGPIAFQRAINFDWTDSGETLYERAQKEIVCLFKDAFARIASSDIPANDQDLSFGRTRRRAELSPRSVFDLDQPTTAPKLLNLLRARTFPPHPGCRFEDQGSVFEVQVSIKKVEKL
jgi:methionyl-tRNA formyltransferase